MLNRARGWFASAPARPSGPSGYALATGACALSLALGMKEFYGHANANELLWVLAPSAWMARFAGGIDLAYEPGAGFISHAHRLVVGPPCAGINFLTICFLTLYFSFARQYSSRVRWLVSSAVIAFGATIAANGLRIFVSAHLWDADIYGGWLTPERMHRLAGTVIYYCSLVALYLVVDSLIAPHPRGRTHRIAPLFWYAGVSLGIPFAGRMVSGGGPGFAEHAVWVLGVALLVTAIMFLPSLRRNRVFWKA